MVWRVCPICGIRFEAVDRRRKYCSTKCRSVARRRQEAIMTAFPDMPSQALDMADMACTFRHMANETLALAAVSPPDVGIVCRRIAGKVIDALDAEGL